MQQPDIDVPSTIQQPGIDVPLTIQQPGIDVPLTVQQPDIDVPLTIQPDSHSYEHPVDSVLLHINESAIVRTRKDIPNNFPVIGVCLDHNSAYFSPISCLMLSRRL